MTEIIKLQEDLKKIMSALWTFVQIHFKEISNVLCALSQDLCTVRLGLNGEPLHLYLQVFVKVGSAYKTTDWPP